MPNVAHLLTTASDDPSLNVPRIPKGTWKGELKRITATSKDREGNPITDKNGDEYSMVKLLVVPETPTEDVDKKLAAEYMKADGPNETGILSMMCFVRRKRDITRVNTTLDALGVPRRGRSYEQIAAEFKGGIPCYFEVEYNDTETDERENVVAIYPIS